MATPYTPGDLPDDPKQLVEALRRELTSIQQAFQRSEEYAEVRPIAMLPTRLRDGMEVEANATLGATLGSGAGKYVRRAGAWVFIG